MSRVQMTVYVLGVAATALAACAFAWFAIVSPQMASIDRLERGQKNLIRDLNARYAKVAQIPTYKARLTRFAKLNKVSRLGLLTDLDDATLSRAAAAIWSKELPALSQTTLGKTHDSDFYASRSATFALSGEYGEVMRATEHVLRSTRLVVPVALALEALEGNAIRAELTANFFHLRDDDVASKGGASVRRKARS
jgi:Tfp pilus assembly protein PilO